MSLHAGSSRAGPHRAPTGAVVLLALAALAFVLVGAWGIVKLGEGDWFIGAGFVACSAVGVTRVLARIARTVRRR